jgi:hypothetical protein
MIEPIWALASSVRSTQKFIAFEPLILLAVITGKDSGHAQWHWACPVLLSSSNRIPITGIIDFEFLKPVAASGGHWSVQFPVKRSRTKGFGQNMHSDSADARIGNKLRSSIM